MTSSRVRSAAAIAPLVLSLAAGLAGCAGSPAPTPSTAAPTATSTPTPTPTVEPAPVPASIVATSTEITVLDEAGRTLLVLEYTDDAEEAVAELVDLLGVDPIRTDVPGTDSGCSVDQSFYDFHGFYLEVPGGVTSRPGSTFTIDVAAVAAGDITLETVDGQQVGVSVGDFLATVPDAVLNGDYGGRQLVGYDVIDPSVEAYERIGALAHGEGGVVTHFTMPYYISGDC